MPRLYPLFADLNNRRVIVVGGGRVAERKVRSLLDTGARIRVVAPGVTADLQELARFAAISWRRAAFQPEHLAHAWLVVAATGDDVLNRRVARAAQARRLFVNVVDDAALSSFQVPANLQRGSVQVAISSGGNAPLLAGWLRGQLEQWLDPGLEPLAALLARWRHRIKHQLPDLSQRRRFYTQLLEGNIAALLRTQHLAQAEAELERSLAGQAKNGIPQTGRVALVGAGPGDAGLLTLHAARLLQQADVILHDRLVGEDVLALARREAVLINVGKRAGGCSPSQQVINRLLRAHAAAGRFVVRLKGGDPCIFGRGGEELEYLRVHGIAYEVVPGITAAIACAAYAGIPLTHRDHAQAVRFVTAHCRSSLDTLNWRALAEDRQTLAVYMGVGQLGYLCERLLENGRAPSTPFALIENGATARQRVLAGQLATLPEQAATANISAPALLIVGEVAALATRLAWFGSGVIMDQPQPCTRPAA